MAIDQTQPLLVRILREPGLDFFSLILPDNSSEEIDAEEAVEWFRLHHWRGKMDYTLIERAIDDAWNFGEANVLIEKPCFPKPETNRTTPNI